MKMSDYSESEGTVRVILSSVKQEPDSNILSDPEDEASYSNHNWNSVPESDETDLDYIITTQEGTPLYDSREPDVIHNLKTKPKKRRREEEPDGRVKRRRRCGECGPCQVKENCGTCQQCLRRSVLKQSCIYRKCLYLRKPVKTFIRFQTQSSVSQSEATYSEGGDGDELLQDDTAFLERPMVLLSPESPQIPSPQKVVQEEDVAEEADDTSAANVEVPVIPPASSPLPEQPEQVPVDNKATSEMPEPIAEDGPNSVDFFQKRILNADSEENSPPPGTVDIVDSQDDFAKKSEILNTPQRELLRQRILKRKLSVGSAISDVLPTPPGQMAVCENLVPEQLNPPVPLNARGPSHSPDNRTIIQDILENVSYKPASQKSKDLSKMPCTFPKAFPTKQSQPSDQLYSDISKQVMEETSDRKGLFESSKGISNFQEDTASVSEKPPSRASHVSFSNMSRRRSSASPASINSNSSRGNMYENLATDQRLKAAKYYNEATGHRLPNHMFAGNASGVYQPNGYPFMGSMESRFYPPRMGYPPIDQRPSPADFYNLPPGYMRPVLFGDRLPGLSNMPPKAEYTGHFKPPAKPESSGQSPAEYNADLRRTHPAALPDSQKHKVGVNNSLPPVSAAEKSRQFSPDAQRQYMLTGSPQHPQGHMNHPLIADSHRHFSLSPGFMDPQRFPSANNHPYRYTPRPDLSHFPPPPDRYPPPGLPHSPLINPNTRHPPPRSVPPDSYPFQTGGPPPRLFSPWMPHGMMFSPHYPGDVPLFPPGFSMEMIRARSAPHMNPHFLQRFPYPPYRGVSDGVEEVEPGEVRRFPAREFQKPECPPPRPPSHTVHHRQNSPIPAKEKDNPPMNDHLRRYLDDVYRNFKCLPSRPSSLPNKTDRQQSEQSSLTDYECEMISIDDFHVSAYIRADGTNSVEIEFDQRSLLEDDRSSVQCDSILTSKQPLSEIKTEPQGIYKEIMINGKSFKVGLCGTVDDTVVLKQDLGEEGVVQIEIPGEKFIVENVFLDYQLIASSSNREKLLHFVSENKPTQTRSTYSF